ncbi:MAG: hypothetical protein AAGD25_11490 [Cyanobacteria bacterium P01_F01_bin.150]
MAVVSHYSQMITLNMGGQRQRRQVTEAADFLGQIFGNGLTDLPNRDVQWTLWKQMQTQSAPESLLAEICLRCFISYQIDQACAQLADQFGHNHGFTQLDLLPYVLSDDGRFYRKSSTQTPNVSLATDILNTIDLERAGLGHWVTQRVKQHSDLNQFLLEQGVYRVSDWAILNDTSGQQLRRILTEFHTLSQMEIETNAYLLTAYHQVYRSDRLKLKKRQGRLCSPPSTDQLQRMVAFMERKTLSRASASLVYQSNTLNNPVNVMKSLRQLADYLRQYRIYARGGRTDNVSLNTPEGQVSVGDKTAELPPDEDAADTFLAQYRVQLKICLDQAIAEVVGDRISQLQKSKKGNADQFVQGLHLFHCCGMSMGEIAKPLKLKAQYQVTRLLKLKEIRADVRRAVLAKLCASVEKLASSYVDIAQLQQMDSALEEQVNAVIQEAVDETSGTRHHPLKSLFARRLCDYLKSISTA